MSKNEVARLKSLRGRLAVLCPETDGLPAKHRIPFTPEGDTREQQIEEIMELAMAVALPPVIPLQKEMSQLLARLISLIYRVEGFHTEEVYQILRRMRFKY